jgi:hypothetical protein
MTLFYFPGHVPLLELIFFFERHIISYFDANESLEAREDLGHPLPFCRRLLRL